MYVLVRLLIYGQRKLVSRVDFGLISIPSNDLVVLDVKRTYTVLGILQYLYRQS